MATIWEIEHTALGAQRRYWWRSISDDLGKKELGGVGFAVGVERIATVLDEQGWPTF